MSSEQQQIWEDVWIPTACARCYAYCGIEVHRVNGVAVEIRGMPNSTQGAEGGLCPKALAGLQVLYDPNRLNVPLRRTNPEKGLFVDPKWKEITWEEVFEEVVPRLQKIRSENPKKLLVGGTTCRPAFIMSSVLYLTLAMGKAPALYIGGGGLHCGNGAHPMSCLVHSSWSVVPDFRYCNYAIYFGASKGHGSGHSAMVIARQAAEARARGMKLVVFDPICNFAAGKATEWVPIIPGTDAAVALAMCNIIVNELGIFDSVYLKTKTNAPYLIGPDGRYVRGAPGAQTPAGKGEEGGAKVQTGVRGPEYVGGNETGKPLVWDAGGGKAKEYDDPTIKDYALEGEYEVNGVKCQPAFQLIREHLKQYTPETASRISWVPAETIRRISNEFAREARVGSTITIDGHELPYRPVSAVIFRGGQGHTNSHQTCFAIGLLNAIVGAQDVPGGTLGWPARSLGYPGTGKLKWKSPWKGFDGFIETENYGPGSGLGILEGEWPLHLPSNEHDLSLMDIFPLCPYTFIFTAEDQEEIWQKTGAPYRIEMLMDFGCNYIVSVANRESAAEALKKIPFIVVSELFNTELTEGFADIVLPDLCYLEQSGWIEGTQINFNWAPGLDDWCYHIMQRVVEPAGQRRDYCEFILECAERMGVKREVINGAWNMFLRLEEENKLQPNEKPTAEAVGSKVVKSWFGPEHDWEWFKKNGFIRWPKKVEEAYWRYFVDGRIPIYLEYLIDVGQKAEEICKEIGLDADMSQYTPLVSWFPCPPHKEKPGYDFICYSYRDVLHTGSHTMEQPWLDEASHMNPYTYNITMNVNTARERGIKNGDIVEIESVTERKVQGPVKLLQGQHPQTIGIAACTGHWAKGLPIAKGKGTNYDILLDIDLKHVDPISLNIETATRVRVRKVRQQEVTP